MHFNITLKQLSYFYTVLECHKHVQSIFRLASLRTLGLWLSLKWQNNTDSFQKNGDHPQAEPTPTVNNLVKPEKHLIKLKSIVRELFIINDHLLTQRNSVSDSASKLLQAFQEKNASCKVFSEYCKLKQQQITHCCSTVLFLLICVKDEFLDFLFTTLINELIRCNNDN